MPVPQRPLALLFILLTTFVAACTPNPPASTSQPEGVPQPENATRPPAGTSATSAPISASEDEPMRIEFQASGNSVTESGTLSSGRVARYVLAAEAGETISAEVTSGQPPVVLSVAGADGSEILPVSAFTQTWQGALPTAQDYYLDLNAPTEFESAYTLTVTREQ